ncbi:MAG TPA: hypothetical protein ENN21_10830 [Spirochaetes bacterium]|nr:hypothetical protein [Spirochaetota bacterium]
MLVGSTSWVKGDGYLHNARALEGAVDFVELLVYTWNGAVRSTLYREMPGLLDLPLRYTVHLPTDNAEHCRRAQLFFEDAGFPVLNYVLHPLPGWREYPWGDRTAVENLTDKIEPYRRMVFDVGHHRLGMPFPKHLTPNIVEVHLMGQRDGKDHCALDREAMTAALPFLRDDMLVNFEVFDMKELKKSLKVFRECVKSDFFFTRPMGKPE